MISLLMNSFLSHKKDPYSSEEEAAVDAEGILLDPELLLWNFSLDLILTGTWVSYQLEPVVIQIKFEVLEPRLSRVREVRRRRQRSELLSCP